MIVIRYIFFFFNDTATTEIYTLSLHDALPIYGRGLTYMQRDPSWIVKTVLGSILLLVPILNFATYGYMLDVIRNVYQRSEEHTSELQSRQYLVCRLLLEKKKKIVS